MESNYYQSKLIPKKPMKPKPYRLERLPSSNNSNNVAEKSSNVKDENEIINLKKDLEILKSKILDCASHIHVEDSTIPSTGIDGPSLKLKLFQELLSRVTLLDREILRITSEDMPRLARRNSRPNSALGSDLFHIPTHLILIDRLIDFHAIIRRDVKNIHHHHHHHQQQQLQPRNNSNTTDVETSSNQLDDTSNSHEYQRKYNELLTIHEDTKNKYVILQQSYDQLLFNQSQFNENMMKSEKKYLQQIHEIQQEKYNQENQIKQLENEKYELNQNKYQLINEINLLKNQQLQLQQQLQEQQQLQQQLQQQQLTTNDGQYTEEITHEIYLLKKDIKLLNEKNINLNRKLNEYEIILQESRTLLLEDSMKISSSSPSHPIDDNNIKEQNQNLNYSDLTNVIKLFLHQYHTLHLSSQSTEQLYQQSIQQLQSLQLSSDSNINQLNQQLQLLNEQYTQQLQQYDLLSQQYTQQQLHLQQIINDTNLNNNNLIKQLEWYQQVEKTLSCQVQEFHHAYIEADESRKHLEFVISILREEEIRAQDLIDDLKYKLTELSKNTGKVINSEGNIV